MKRKVLVAVFTILLAIPLGVGGPKVVASENGEAIEELQIRYNELEKKYDDLLKLCQQIQTELSELQTLIGPVNTESMPETGTNKEVASGENVLYAGEWGVLTFKGVDENGVNFSLENTTDIDYVLYSDYLSLDGIQYSEDWDEETEEAIGGVYENIGAGSIRDFKFLVKLDICDISDITGQFLICEFGTGCDLGLINF